MSSHLLAELTGHGEKVWHVSWHPTHLALASCGGDRSIRIWRPPASSITTSNASPLKPATSAPWTCVSVLDDAHKRTIRSVEFNPSGKLLASASFDATTAVWEKDGEGSFECVATLEGHENEVKSVAWSVSGTLLATCSRDKSVWIWEAIGDNDFECLSVLQDHTQDVKMVKWHPTEEILASASYDDTIKIWRDDEDDWICMDTLRGHTSTVWSVDFDATGKRLASVSDDRSLRIWTRSGTSLRDTKYANTSTRANLHRRAIYDVSWSKSHGLIATSAGDNTIRLVSVNDNGDIEDVAQIIEPHGKCDINCVSWCPLEGHGDLLASAGDDGSIRIWRIERTP
ncbi:hypothetical protein HK101_004252 [Irineochytrium annulatum]|nr:hypothetical protein HK101_004252 [Irineochytrium annulatum]